MIRAPLRLRTALTVAVLGHLLAAVSIRAVPRPAGARGPVPIDQEITLLPEDPRVEAIAPVAHEAAPGAQAVAHASVGGSHGPRAHGRDVPAEEAALAPPGEPVPAASGWTFDPLRRGPPDVGSGAQWKIIAREGAGPGGAPPPPSAMPGDEARARARAIEGSMRAMLNARDVELGLGRAGPLVAATHAAASAEGEPEVGTTILEVESDAAGIVVAARADDRAWAPVASALVRQMAGKPLRVRPGGRGIRARLRVVAERAPPAGARGTSHVGAVPDDVPGGGKACVGEGITRRCAAGMPAGVTAAGSDLSNIGAKPRRIVHVQLLGESEL